MQYLKLQYENNEIADVRSALDRENVNYDVITEKNAIDPALAETLVTVVIPVSIGLAQIVTAIILNRSPKVIVIKDQVIAPSELSPDEIKRVLRSIEKTD